LFIKIIPIQYEGIKTEHDYVRNSIDIFDDSPMGEFVLKRENKITLLQKATPNEASIMVDGQEQ
jgi:aminomethyltransferase